MKIHNSTHYVNAVPDGHAIITYAKEVRAVMERTDYGKFDEDFIPLDEFRRALYTLFPELYAPLELPDHLKERNAELVFRICEKLAQREVTA